MRSEIGCRMAFFAPGDKHRPHRNGKLGWVAISLRGKRH